MELKELIGLHRIKRIAVFRDEDGIEDTVHFTMAGIRHRAVRVDYGRDGQRLRDIYLGVESDADGDGFPVFCIHRDAYGPHGFASDILEIYDIKTAKPFLIIGTEEIDIFPQCRIDYYPKNIHFSHKEKLLK